MAESGVSLGWFMLFSVSVIWALDFRLIWFQATEFHFYFYLDCKFLDKLQGGIKHVPVWSGLAIRHLKCGHSQEQFPGSWRVWPQNWLPKP